MQSDLYKAGYAVVLRPWLQLNLKLSRRERLIGHVVELVEPYISNETTESLVTRFSSEPLPLSPSISLGPIF